MSKDVRAQIEWVVNDVVKKYQKDGEDTIEVKIDNRHGYRPVVHRDKDLVDIARKTSGQVIEDVKLTDEKLLGGEDFSFYLEELRGKQIPGIFMMIGAANKEKGINKSPHHNPKFQIDPDMLQDMAAIHAGFVINYFADNKKESK
jgi:metal-dependent amidase/aminoacylase/carboxypeptidase family protein